ncbi:MAG: META domain-containing protein [Chitinophagaceae bacterium]|nr:META domain-containing protein [Chitinophagaceae bacterium]
MNDLTASVYYNKTYNMQNTFTFSLMAILLFYSFNRDGIIADQYRHDDTPVSKLEEHRWYLSTIYKTNGYTEIMTRKAFILFRTADGKISGNGSCNSFGGKLTIDGNTLIFGNIFSTKMYCSDVQSVEDDFFKQLQKVTRYEIKGNKLLLFEGDNLVLEFVE